MAAVVGNNTIGSAGGAAIALGDDSRAFPPLMGQGANSAQEEVAVLRSVLDRVGRNVSLVDIENEYKRV